MTLTDVSTLMMTSAQVVETSVNVTSNSPSQDYTHPDDHNLPNYEILDLLLARDNPEVFYAFLLQSFHYHYKLGL